METRLDDIIPFLTQTEIARKLAAEDISALVPYLDVLRVEEEACIIREGAPGDAWYVVMEGEVCVSKNVIHGPPHVLSHLGAGECFGEMALIDGSPRLASIHAVTDAALVRLPAASFQRLIDENPALAMKLVLAMGGVIAQRQRELTYILTDLMEIDDPEAEPDPDTLAAMLRSSLG